MRKRKVTYPPKRSDRPAPPPAGAGPEPAYVRATVAAIDLRARAGRDGLPVGTRVRITGSGLYSGEAAVVESVAGGVISSVMVRTESGRTRRVRTIDLEPITEEGRQPASPG
jgi:hypothetical protein